MPATTDKAMGWLRKTLGGEGERRAAVTDKAIGQPRRSHGMSPWTWPRGCL